MGEYHIIGGKKLLGEVNIKGAKNAILPIVAATVLNEGISIIYNWPDISDINIATKILEEIGCTVKYEKEALVIDSRQINTEVVPEKLVSKMRSSIIFLGAILGRLNKCTISYPGGCELGARPIDLHLKGLKSLGVNINESNGNIICETKKLEGGKVHLDFPSVGATENIMLASVLATGETIITNPAREPEIIDLQNFLNKMGAKVKGAGTGKIVIKGVKKLQNVEYTVMPDRIVAGTYLVAGGISYGEIILKDVNCEDMASIISKLIEIGCTVNEYKKSNVITLKSPKTIKAVKKIRTLPHPGFPTDMQSQIMTFLTLAKGTSVVSETVFESRKKHVSELIKMGADIITGDGMTSIVKGVDKLMGTTVYAKDLRGGASLIIAGLAAEGKTIVKNSYHVERGYENIEKVIQSLGGNIILKQ